MIDKKIIAENIRALRLSSGMSQNALAELLHISTQSVSKWECGNSVPDLDNLLIMSKIFGVTLEYIIGGEYISKEVMIGIDSGGSKTEFICFDSDGNILRRILKGAGNPNTVGFDKCISLIEEGIAEALPPDCRLAALYMGGSGLLTGNNGEKLRAILMKKHPGTRIKCESDIYNVIASGTNDENCIAVICGTGSVVFVKEGECLKKYGGWGPFLSKSGSGYDIGRDGIVAAVSEREGMGEETLITKYVEEKAGIPVEDMVGEIYKKDQSYVASFSSCVFKAYSENDKIAYEILKENAKALCRIINFAAEKHGIYGNIILSGGIVSNDDCFLSFLRKNIDAGITVTVPDIPQIIGACILAARLCGKNTEEIKNKLLKEYNEKVRK